MKMIYIIGVLVSLNTIAAETCTLSHPKKDFFNAPWMIHSGGVFGTFGYEDCDPAIAKLKSYEDDGSCKVDWNAIKATISSASRQCNIAVDSIIATKSKLSGSKNVTKSMDNGSNARGVVVPVELYNKCTAELETLKKRDPSQTTRINTLLEQVRPITNSTENTGAGIAK